MAHMTMKDYSELRAAQEGAEMMREAIAIQIADRVANNDDVPKELVRHYRVAQLAVESTTKDVHDCLNLEATVESFKED